MLDKPSDNKFAIHFLFGHRLFFFSLLFQHSDSSIRDTSTVCVVYTPNVERNTLHMYTFLPHQPLFRHIESMIKQDEESAVNWSSNGTMFGFLGRYFKLIVHIIEYVRSYRKLEKRFAFSASSYNFKYIAAGNLRCMPANVKICKYTHPRTSSS